MVPGEMTRTSLYSVFILFLGLRCLAVEFQTNCPQDYLQYGEQTCFKFFFDTQDSFDGSSRYCQDQETGQLITISNAAQLNLISTYVKLYTVLPYWVGLRYYNSSVLTDIDGTIVDAGLFNLEYQADQGDCVSVIHSSDGDVKISQMDCSQVNNFVCLKKWPAPPNSVDITGTPTGYNFIGVSVAYGFDEEDVQLTCQFTIPDDDWSARVMIQWRFNGVDINGASEELSSGIATHTVTDFQITNEGMYSCVVSTDYWSVTSTNLFVKMAGSPGIERYPQNVTVYMGQQGFFECKPTIESFPVPDVIWYKNETRLDVDGQQSKYFVSPDTKTLLLSQVDDSDVGAYHCVLQNPVGQLKSNTQYLTVIPATNDSEIAPEIKLHPQSVTVLVGRNATFDCVGSDSYNHSSITYKWLAYDSDASVIDTSYSVLSRPGVFSYQVYSDIQLDDISFVQCVFEETVNSANATITVNEQAYITDINDEDTLQYGSDVELTCTFKGRPAPVAEWFFNGQLVNQENYRTVGYSSVLTVKDFQPNNVGVYQCRVSNCPCHSHTRSINLYGTDGKPGAVFMSLLALSKSEVSVGWWSLSQPNSDPQLIQYQVMWSNLNDKSSTDQFRQFPPTANNYTITGLAPDYHLSVTMVAVTPNGEGIVSPPILIYPLGNAPDHPPRSVHVLRFLDQATHVMEISWEAVIPDHNKGEGDMIAYHVQYRNFGMETGMTNEQVSSDVTSVTIYGVSPDVYYEVRVRCVVMTQILPPEFESCPWSEWVESDGTPTGAPIKGSDSNTSLKVGIPVAIIAVVLVVLLTGCLVYKLRKWVGSRHSSVTSVAYSSMKNENAEDEDMPVEAALDEHLEMSVRKDLA